MALKDFHTRLEVMHYPTGYSFRKQGRRIVVEDEYRRQVDSFTAIELQEMAGDKLISPTLLRRLANDWIRNNT